MATCGRTIKAVICTLDNLPILKEQVEILRADPLISEIVVVCNGSIDCTAEWLDGRADLTSIIRENNGAGPGRNAGIDAALPFDYALMLDGGIRPLRDGVRHMLDYMERRQDCDVLGVEIPDLETDYDKAWRRWPGPITDAMTYRNTRLSHTAYCLSRARAWDGLRFCEEGPFGMPGWGADDDEMAYQWNDAGIVVHVVTKIHPYRRPSGSFRRLYRETGVWPNQYGSVYEMRVVWLQQNWPQYQPGVYWGEPWLTVVVKAGEKEATAKLVKAAHDGLRVRRFAGRWSYLWNPYSVVLWMVNPSLDMRFWAEWRCLRQHHGDCIVVGKNIIRRNADNEATWTGDFRMWEGDDWRAAVRDTAHYYTLVEDMDELERALAAYDERYPRQDTNTPPDVRREELTWRH